MTVGFLGVGAIGRPMAERMLDQSPLIVCDESAPAREYFFGRAEITNSPQELSNRAEIVFACLPSHASYRTAVLSRGGLLSNGRVRILVHVGTTGPDLAKEMNEACYGRRALMLDAPVTGGPDRARKGHLGVMLSGPREALVEVEPLIRSYASSITYLGEVVGHAQLMKLMNNMLSAANLAVAAEILVLGVKAGLDPVQMLEVLNNGTGQNSATLTKIPLHILPRTFDYGGRLAVAYKDLESAVEQGDRLNLPMPLCRLVEASYARAIAEEGPNADMTTVIRYMERTAQVEVKGSMPESSAAG